MAKLVVNNVSIKGIAASAPKVTEYNSDIYGKWGGVDAFVSTTGVKQKRKAPKEVCSSDLCFEAAEKLIADLKWDISEIDALVFVSQTPDYRLPATSCLLQERLGLSQNCYTLDVSLGCSGWVYGMSVITSLMQNGTIKKGLLLVGDTPLKLCSENDKSTYPLFGDAGTCTALEYEEGAAPMTFCMHTDGTGADAIITPEDGCRNMATRQSFEEITYGDGLVRNPIQVAMEGMSVFTFGISKAPKVVKELMETTDEDVADMDIVTFHQANLFMNEKIRKKLKLTEEQVPYSMDEFGNTSCASIPLTLVTRRAEKIRNGAVKHVGCGFGVGLSWGAVRFDTDKIVVPELIEV